MTVENPYLQKYLQDRQWNLSGHRVPVDGRDRINQLLAARVPINYATAEGIYEKFRMDLDIEGMRLLYHVGQGGYGLLGDVTSFLLATSLNDERKTRSPRKPLKILQTLITDDLLHRVGSDEFDRVEFCNDIIGQGEVTMMHRQFETIVEKLYEGVTLPSPFKGLRALVNDHVINLHEEAQMEEWLCQRCRLSQDATENFRQTRHSWHIELGSYDPQNDNDPIYAKKRFTQAIDASNIYQALYYLDRLPPGQQVYACWDAAQILLQQSGQADAIKLLVRFRNSFQELDINPENKKDYLTQIATYQILAGDETNLGPTLELIDQKGYNQLLRHLGVPATTLNDLCLFCHFEESDVYFKALDSLVLKRLISGSYMEKPFMRKDQLLTDSQKMFASLVAARIFHLGEVGLNFPSPDNYRTTKQVAWLLSLWYGKTGNSLKFTEWVGHLFQTSSDGDMEVRAVYEELSKFDQ